MNKAAMATLICEVAKDWRIKIDRDVSLIGKDMDVILVDEDKSELAWGSLVLGCDPNSMPDEFTLTEIFFKAEFQVAIRAGLKDCSSGDLLWDILDRMFYDSFCVTKVMIDADDTMAFKDVFTNHLVFVLGSPANNISAEFGLSNLESLDAIFSNDFYQRLKAAAES